MTDDRYDESDMGPYADMDPDLVKSVSSYGTPPYRMAVRVAVRAEGHSAFADLPDTIDGWIAWLEAARSDAPAEYRSALKCVLSFDYGYADSGESADLSIWYIRRETDAEMVERVDRGISYVRQKADAERRQYEALKAKFG